MVKKIIVAGCILLTGCSLGYYGPKKTNEIGFVTKDFYIQENGVPDRIIKLKDSEVMEYDIYDIDSVLVISGIKKSSLKLVVKDGLIQNYTTVEKGESFSFLMAPILP